MRQSQPNTVIRPLVESDYAAVDGLVAQLTEWFDERARTTSIPVDIKHQHGFVAVRLEEVVGFITLYVAEGKLNIGWLGVKLDLHRQGIGCLLLAKAVEVAQAIGVQELVTHTLGDGVEDRHYARTRQFYFANGFHIYQRNRRIIQAVQRRSRSPRTLIKRLYIASTG